MKKSPFKITGYIVIITAFCTNFVYAQRPVIEVTSSRDYTFEEQYTDEAGTSLKAYVTPFIDEHDPEKFELRAPSNGSVVETARPTFSWDEAHDDKRIDHYVFWLEGELSDGTRRTYEYSFGAGGGETSDYRVWFEDGKYYLELASDLAEGKYRWRVTASDSQNETQSDTWEFTYSKSLACDQRQALSGVTVTAPSSSVDSRAPAIVIAYRQYRPTLMDVIVDGVRVLTSVSLTASATSSYTVSDNGSQLIFQAATAYLPAKATNSYTLQLRLYDDSDCQADFDLGTISVGALECTRQALVPQLLAPESDAESINPVTTFSWSVCSPARDIDAQVFTLNGQPLYTLGATSATSEDYTFRVSAGSTSTCPQTTTMTLTLKKASLIAYNDPNQKNDWNRWQVTVSGCNRLTVTSPVSRFRYVPGSRGTYYWCTNQSQCTSGTLEECVASGRTCYLADKNKDQTCLSHAQADCSANPPEQSYFWCTNQSQCTKGTLAQCSQSGKNCYLQLNDRQGDTGCLQHAYYECSERAQYYWCESSQRCGSGSFEECAATGHRCYRQTGESRQDECTAQVRQECVTASGTLANNPFGTIPDFAPNLIDFLAELGIDNKIIVALESLSTEVFPFVSTILLLPLGLLIIFFPRPRGRVYDRRTRQGVARALVLVTREGQYVTASLTNARGFFDGFKLPPGEYRITVSALEHIFPAAGKRPSGRRLQSYYLGETFRLRSEFAPMITYQIPVDLDPQVELTPEQERERNRRHFWASIWQGLVVIFNWLSWLWALSFIVALIFTLIYPIWLNIIILAVYIMGFIRRLIASLHRANLTGRVLDSDGQPVARLPLRLTQVAFDRPAGETITNKQGYFESYLNPSRQYRLTASGVEFVETEGEVPEVLLDFGHDNRLELLLVVRIKNDEI